MSDIDVTARVVDRGNDSRIVGQIIPPIGTTVGNVLTATATGSSWQAGGGGGFYQTVQDEGVDLTQRAKMNFVGAGVTAADSGGVTTVTIPGGGSGGGSRVPFVYRHDVAPTSGEITNSLVTTTAVTAVTNTPPTTGLGYGNLNDGIIAAIWDDNFASSNRPVVVKYDSINPLVVCDLFAASQLTWFYVFGIGGNAGFSVLNPSAVKLESSDDATTWATVENRTGLAQTNVGAYCRFNVLFDCTGAGSHRYWRYSSTRGTSQWTGLSEIVPIA